MYFSSYGPLKFTLKFAQNAKSAVNHTLRWNNSSLLTDWETVLALNNYMSEMNSEIISRFQVPNSILDMVGPRSSSSQNMYHVSNTFLVPMLPAASWGFKVFNSFVEGLSISLINWSRN